MLHVGAIDLRKQLFGGAAFTMPCRISTNGLSLPLNGLIDTGVGSYTLIHPKHLRAVKKNLRAQNSFISLPRASPPTDPVRNLTSGCQVEPDELPTVVNGQPEWEIEAVLDSRINRTRLQYGMGRR